MCERPKTWWVNGEAVTTACQECKQCVRQRTNDWVGRCIAESKTSTKAHAVTLTYGRDEFGNEDHPRAKLLTYSDVQKWFKLLRRHGYPCRYFLSGEYGPLKGRTHWHFIVFWLDQVPAWAGYDQFGKWSDNHITRGERVVRFNHQRLTDEGEPAFVRGEPAFWWPHGWTQVSEGATVEAIKYVCKYIRKDVSMGKQSHFMMSKQPPLGAAYFARRAERYVAAGLAPQGGMGYLEGRLEFGMGGYRYAWPDVTYVNKQGRRVAHEFQLRDVSLDMFLAHYVATWDTVWPGRDIPASKLVEGFLSPGAWKDVSPSQQPLRLRNHPPVTDAEKLAALERVRGAAIRRGDIDGDVFRFQSEFEALRPEFEARARQILWHKSEYKIGKQKRD